MSLFEHKSEIVPDKGIKDKIANDEWQKVIESMKPSLKNKKFDEAFLQSISKITEILEIYKLTRNGESSNELPDHLRENI
jgi:uncharacterized membrane protein